MGIDLQTVELLIGIPLLLVQIGSVGMRENTADVAYIVVDDIVLDAVVVLKALHDVVFHLPAHHALSGTADGGYNNQDADEDGENDNLAQTTAGELLPRCLFLVDVTVKLFHSVLVLKMFSVIGGAAGS